MKYTAIAFAVILAGCDAAHISEGELERLNHTCDKNSGMNYAEMARTSNRIVCKDGAIFEFDNISDDL